MVLQHPCSATCSERARIAWLQAIRSSLLLRRSSGKAARQVTLQEPSQLRRTVLLARGTPPKGGLALGSFRKVQTG